MAVGGARWRTVTIAKYQLPRRASDGAGNRTMCGPVVNRPERDLEGWVLILNRADVDGPGQLIAVDGSKSPCMALHHHLPFRNWRWCEVACNCENHVSQ